VRPLIVTALRDELRDCAMPDDYAVLFTGVGKVNAAMALTEALLSTPASMVINFGTAGAIDANTRGLHEHRVDVVDMELFAIAAVCRRLQIPWRSFKFVSDSADENAAEDWQGNVDRGAASFLAQLERLRTDTR